MSAPIASDAPRLLLRYVAAALVRKLGLSDAQVRVDVAPYTDPGWNAFPVFQVVPGPEKAEPGGQGAQDGGGVLRRRLYFTVHLYVRAELDPYQVGEALLTRDAEGMLVLSEEVRALFAKVWFGDGSGAFLLSGPIRWEGAGNPQWVDAENRIVRRDLSLSAPFDTDLPEGVTLTVADVL